MYFCGEYFKFNILVFVIRVSLKSSFVFLGFSDLGRKVYRVICFVFRLKLKLFSGKEVVCGLLRVECVIYVVVCNLLWGLLEIVFWRECY